MNSIRHDFRSDNFTRPTTGMREAMATAEVGDDVFGDDPSVNLLEQRMAGMLGKEAALFVSSGTMSNLLALMSYCGRGDEFIAGQNAHCYKYEAGGAAVLGSIQPQPIAHQADGRMSLGDIEGSIKSGDSHFATTRVIALENTFGGKVLPFSYMQAVAEIAQRRGLGLHLDGARAFNATTKLGMDIKAFVAPFDTVSICLSKGLGAPVGSVLIGRRDLIETARRNRKMLGGGLRQSGILAAAGLYALDHNIERLAEDHRRALKLAQGLARHEALRVSMPDTNIVWVDMKTETGDQLGAHLEAAGIAVMTTYGRQRWVTHLDIGNEAIDAAIESVDRYFS